MREGCWRQCGQEIFWIMNEDVVAESVIEVHPDHVGVQVRSNRLRILQGVTLTIVDC